MKRTGKPASELRQSFEPVPQLLKNVRYEGGADPLLSERVRTVIGAAETRLAGTGRLLIRKSGTEPVVRVMAECEDPVTLVDVVDSIVAEVAAARG